ncbi:uncharacterized protein [Lepeophtheirus salmonis]|uniref:uncharacterized protein n=1 Tax=Lepeophtheirus salmonis TaxID=72036 RepID=UPI001AE7E074|nr:uncharacterized protein LOC121120348 [Lepeophtheirus salmonis]
MKINSTIHNLLRLLLVSSFFQFGLMEETKESLSSGRSFFSFEDSVYSTYYNIFHDGKHPSILLGGRREEENEPKGFQTLNDKQTTERVPSAEPLVHTTPISKSSSLVPKVFFNDDRSKIIFSPVIRRSRRPKGSRRSLKFGTKLKRRNGFSSLKDQRKMFSGDRLLYSLGLEDEALRKNRDITTTTTSRPTISKPHTTFTHMNLFESLKVPVTNSPDPFVRKNLNPLRVKNDQDTEFRTTIDNSYFPLNEATTTMSNIVIPDFSTESVREDTFVPENSSPNKEDTISKIQENKTMVHRKYENKSEISRHENVFSNGSGHEQKIKPDETEFPNEYFDKPLRAKNEQIFPGQAPKDSEIGENEDIDYNIRRPEESITTVDPFNQNEGNNQVQNERNNQVQKDENIINHTFDHTATTHINVQTNFDAKYIETTTNSQQLASKIEKNIDIKHGENSVVNTFEHTPSTNINEHANFDDTLLETTTNRQQFLEIYEDNTVFQQEENINTTDHTTVTNIDESSKSDVNSIETATNIQGFENRNEENTSSQQDEALTTNEYEQTTPTNINEPSNSDVNFIETTTNSEQFANQNGENIVIKPDENILIDVFEEATTTNINGPSNFDVNFIETTTNGQLFFSQKNTAILQNKNITTDAFEEKSTTNINFDVNFIETTTVTDQYENNPVTKQDENIIANAFEHTTQGPINELTNFHVKFNKSASISQSKDISPTTRLYTTFPKHQETIFPATNQEGSSILNRMNNTHDSSLNISKSIETSFPSQSFLEQSQIVPPKIQNDTKSTLSEKIHNSVDFIKTVSEKMKDFPSSPTFISNPSHSTIYQGSQTPNNVTLNTQTNSSIASINNGLNVDRTIHNLDPMKKPSEENDSTKTLFIDLRSVINLDKGDTTTRIHSEEDESITFSNEELTKEPIWETSTSYPTHPVDAFTENTIYELETVIPAKKELYNDSQLLSDNNSGVVESTTPVPGLDASTTTFISVHENGNFDVKTTSKTDIEIVDERLVNPPTDLLRKGIKVLNIGSEEVTTSLNDLSNLDDENTSIETTTLFLKELKAIKINQKIHSATETPQSSRTNNIITTNKPFLSNEEPLKMLTDIFLPSGETEPITFQKPTQNKKIYLDSDEPLAFSTLDSIMIDPNFDDIDFELETERPNSSLVLDNGIVKFSISTFINDPTHSNASQIKGNGNNLSDTRSSETTTKPNFNYLIRNRNAAFVDQVQERSFYDILNTNNTSLIDNSSPRSGSHFILETKKAEDNSQNKDLSNPVTTTTHHNLAPNINPIAKSNNTQRVDMETKLIDLNETTNSSNNASIPLKKHSHILNKLHAKLKDISVDQLQLIEDEIVDLISFLGPDINLDVLELRNLLNSSTNKRRGTIVEAIMRSNALRAKANLLQSKSKRIIEGKNVVLPEPLKTILKNYGSRGLGQILSIMSIKNPEGMAELLSGIFEYDTLNDKEKTIQELIELTQRDPEAVGESFSTLIANTLKNVNLSVSAPQIKLPTTTQRPPELEPLTIAPTTFLSTLIQFIKGGTLSHKELIEELINSGLLPVEVTNIGKIPIVVGAKKNKEPLQKEIKFENVDIDDPKFDYEEFDLNSFFETTERPNISNLNRNIEFITSKSNPEDLNYSHSTTSNIFDYRKAFQQTTTSSNQVPFDNNIETSQGSSEQTTTESSKQDFYPSKNTLSETTTSFDSELAEIQVETTQSPDELFPSLLYTTTSSLHILDTDFETIITTTKYVSSPSVRENSFEETSINPIDEISQITQHSLTSNIDVLETTTGQPISVSTPFVYETTESSLIDFDYLTSTLKQITDTTESFFFDSTTPSIGSIKKQSGIFSSTALPSILSEVEEFIPDQLNFPTLSPLKMSPINSDDLRYKSTTTLSSSKINKADSFGIFPTQTLKPLSTRTTIMNTLKMKQPLLIMNDEELDCLLSVLRLYKQGIISDSEFLELMHELKEDSQQQMQPRIDDHEAPRFQIRPAPQIVQRKFDDSTRGFSHEFISNFPNAFSEFSQDHIHDQFPTSSISNEDQHSYTSRDYFSPQGKAKKFQTFSYTNHPPYPREPFGPPRSIRFEKSSFS